MELKGVAVGLEKNYNGVGYTSVSAAKGATSLSCGIRRPASSSTTSVSAWRSATCELRELASASRSTTSVGSAVSLKMYYKCVGLEKCYKLLTSSNATSLSCWIPRSASRSATSMRGFLFRRSAVAFRSSIGCRPHEQLRLSRWIRRSASAGTTSVGSAVGLKKHYQ